MKIRTMKQFLHDSLRGIVRNRIMSIASIGTVAATLFIFGTFMIMALNMNNMVNSVGDQIEIKVFINKDTKPEDAKALEPQIKATPHVAEVKFETKDQALENMKEQLGDKASLAEGFEENNPLPESYIVKVDAPENVEATAQALVKLKGISEVKDGKSMVDKIIRITDVVKTSSILLMVVFGIVALFLIANTIKLTVYARKREINIMKYIGATDWFIRWPFVIEGVILGLCGSLLSIGLLAASYSYMESKISNLVMMFTPVPLGHVMALMSWQFILLGVLIGGIGSLLSLRKFLRV